MTKTATQKKNPPVDPNATTFSDQMEAAFKKGQEAAHDLTGTVKDGAAAAGEFGKDVIDSTKKAANDLMDSDDKDHSKETPAEKKAREADEKKKKEAEDKKIQDAGKNGSEEKSEGIWGKIKKFFTSLNIGDMTGGLLGAFGGWMAGRAFGGGIVGTIAGALLAVGGMFMGKEALGPKLNSLMGRSNSDSGVAKTEGGAAPAATLPPADATQGRTGLSNAELAVIHEEFNAARRNVRYTASHQNSPSTPIVAGVGNDRNASQLLGG